MLWQALRHAQQRDSYFPGGASNAANTMQNVHSGKRCVQYAGPKDKLDSTAVSQPAIYVASLAALEKLKQTEGQVCTSHIIVFHGHCCIDTMLHHNSCFYNRIAASVACSSDHGFAGSFGRCRCSRWAQPGRVHCPHLCWRYEVLLMHPSSSTDFPCTTAKPTQHSLTSLHPRCRWAYTYAQAISLREPQSSDICSVRSMDSAHSTSEMLQVFVLCIMHVTSLLTPIDKPSGAMPCRTYLVHSQTCFSSVCLRSFEDGLQLVKLRGESMQAAADTKPSAMVSVIGLSSEKVCRSNSTMTQKWLWRCTQLCRVVHSPLCSITTQGSESSYWFAMLRR